MRALRHFTKLTRLALAWFVLAMGAATASSLIQPQEFLVVCSSPGAMKLLIQAPDGNVSEGGSNTMDCPLCIPPVAPPPTARLIAEPTQPLAYALQAIPSAHIAALTSAPLPPRGPPSV